MNELRRDVKLGRIALVTIEDDVTEQVGGTLEAIGSAIAVGERRPKGVNLSLPVRGSTRDADPYKVGGRMRRQVRSLLDNPITRRYGHYLTTAFDRELNGWHMIGGGDLSYGEEGGPTLAQYQLGLEDMFRVATRLSHRRATRVEVADRRLSTTPRDLLGRVFSTSFSSITGKTMVGICVNPTNVVGRSGLLTPGVYPTREGSVSYVTDVINSELVHYEQNELDHWNSDVVIYDRRGNTTPTEVFTPRTNLVANPGAERDAQKTIAVGSVTIGRTFEEVRTGIASFKVVTNGAGGSEGIRFDGETADYIVVGAGNNYNWSTFVKGPAGAQLRLTMLYLDSAGVAIPGATTDSSPFTLTGQWQRLSMTTLSPAGGVRLRVHVKTVAAQTITFFVDDNLVERGPAGVYGEPFTGDNPGARWIGAQGLSSSVFGDDPQIQYGWEEVYGPGYPLTPGDVPVLDNGVCRVRLQSVGNLGALFRVDKWDDVNEEWDEQLAINVQNGNNHLPTLAGASIKEWSPERAVVHARFMSPTRYSDIYITLQRAWTGPRVEAYTHDVGAPTRIQLIPMTTQSVVFTKANFNYAETSGSWATQQPTWTSLENPGFVLQTSGSTPDIYGTVPLHTAQSFHELIDESTVYGGLRRGVMLKGDTNSQRGWWAIDVRIDDGTYQDVGSRSLMDSRGVPDLIAR